MGWCDVTQSELEPESTLHYNAEHKKKSVVFYSSYTKANTMITILHMNICSYVLDNCLLLLVVQSDKH